VETARRTRHRLQRRPLRVRLRARHPVIGADNLAAEKVVQQIDATGDGDPETFVIPLHGAFLRDMGVQLNEILDLRELSAACAEDGVYEFLFTAAPLNVERATGSPVNPLVLKATGKGDGDEERGEDRRRLSSSPTARQTRSEMAAATSSSSSSEGSGGVPATA
jgi:hypothetical protein